MENRFDKFSFVISALIHLAIFVFAYAECDLHGGEGVRSTQNKNDQGKNQPKGEEAMNVIPKPPQVVEVSLVEPPKKKEPGSKQKAAAKTKNCKKYYGGIGVYVHPFTNMIEVVYEGYAASRLGIKVGDIVVMVTETGIEETIVRGAVGEPITLKITSGNQIRIVTVAREKICAED